MLNILFWVIVGIFVGWNIPQPGYAKWIQNKIVSKYNEIRLYTKIKRQQK